MTTMVIITLRDNTKVDVHRDGFKRSLLNIVYSLARLQLQKPIKIQISNILKWCAAAR